VTDRIVIGTRGSALALWQAEHVRDRLAARFPRLRVEIRIVKTTGDRILNQALSRIGDRGLFTKDLDAALLDGRIDVAVHSLKDVPTEVPSGIRIAAITRREDVRDVLIAKSARSLEALREGATVATGSLRRRSQLLHLRPDLRIAEIRGNLQTRMEKFARSSWDGMLLAYAGVKRLGWEDRVAQIVPAALLLPAVGQGALGVEIRSNDDAAARIVRVLHHARSAAACLAERALLRALEGGCQVPIGAHARFANGRLVLDAIVGSVDGTIRIDARGTAASADGAGALGRRVARRLLAHGAREVLDDIRTGGRS
jgi:hydroxymethylbilane synthase